MSAQFSFIIVPKEMFVLQPEVIENIYNYIKYTFFFFNRHSNDSIISSLSHTVDSGFRIMVHFVTVVLIINYT